MKTLVIAEKPSVGRTIAGVLLGAGGEKKDGYIEGKDWIVSWCRGHLVTSANPEFYDEKFKKWTLEDLPIMPENWLLVPIDSSKDQLKVVRNLMARSDVSDLVEATDAGREGELIFRLVYDYVGCKKPFKRLWISSLESSAIREGFDNLKSSKEYDNLYDAAVARMRADWLFGLNGSRYYSLLSDEFGVKSVGRVQTPTLAMIVKRQEEIDNFVVTPRWVVQKDFEDWKVETDYFTDLASAKKCLKETEEQDFVVKKIEKQTKKLSPPKLFSLSSLQQEANRKWGYTAQQVLDSIQKLYEAKILTYPRTDSNYITSDMENTVNNITNNLAKAFKDLVPGFKNCGAKRLINNEKVTDHHAILITESFSRNPDARTYEGIDRQMIRLVETRMLEAVSPVYEYEETKVTGTSKEYEFEGTGQTVVNDGWRAISKQLLQIKDKERNVFPEDLAEGKSYKSASTEVISRDTVPPKYYTDETLLKAMEMAGAKDMDDDVERKGLGTSATRASMIEILIKRNYVIRDKKSLKATESGKKLIASVDDGFKNVDTTVNWENRLLEIERGKGETKEEFCISIESLIKELLKNGPKSATKKANFIYGKCPICGGNVESYFSNARCSGCGVNFYITDRVTGKAVYTPEQVTKLLDGGKVKAKRWSTRTNKPYTAIMSINVEQTKQNMSDEKKYFAFNMEFENKKK